MTTKRKENLSAIVGRDYHRRLCYYCGPSAKKKVSRSVGQPCLSLPPRPHTPPCSQRTRDIPLLSNVRGFSQHTLWNSASRTYSRHYCLLSLKHEKAHRVGSSNSRPERVAHYSECRRGKKNIIEQDTVFFFCLNLCPFEEAQPQRQPSSYQPRSTMVV